MSLACIFIPDKSFGQFLDTSPKNFVLISIFNSEFLHIEVKFTDKSFKPLNIEDKISINLGINQCVMYKN